jgi:GT2 family glycosyltransferase
MDDSLEVLPDCLGQMLSFEHTADLIQVRKVTPIHEMTSAAEPDWARVQYCDFDGALIGREVIENAGLPDPRYFNIADDTAYGYVAALHVSSICLQYAGVLKHEDSPEKTEMAFYLSVRNRFLTREHLAKNGQPPAFRLFLAETLLGLLKTLSAAVASPEHKMRRARAAIDGLRDGIHGRFDRLPAM